MINYSNFEAAFNSFQKNDYLVIRYSKEKGKQISHRDIDIYREFGKLYVSGSSIPKTEITDESLKNEHADLVCLFSALNKNTTKQDSYKLTNHKFKWFVRNFILNTWLVGGLVGKIIAYSANRENPYYKTVPSKILADTLGPLIFPAGSKKPLLKEKGLISIDRVLHKQYQAMRNYKSKYSSLNGNSLVFKKEPVSVTLRQQQCQLETVSIDNQLVKPESRNHLHLIYFNGNCSCFQEDHKLVAEDLVQYAHNNIAATAIQFNYPGILKSEGSAERAQDLIDSGIAQVQALLDKGVPHHKIALHGVSLGGSIASYVAAHFHKNKQTLGGLYVSRTFASTAQVGRDFFNRALGDNLFSRIISTLALPFIKLGTWGAEWDLDSGKAFFSLPLQKRNYSVVISPKSVRKAYQKRHQGPLGKRILNTLLRCKKNPADDPILKRGLHDSWERRWDGFLSKRGFLGKNRKDNYSQENRARKMVVMNLTTIQLAQEIDGHAKANYCYMHNNLFCNPRKSKVFGLIHRMSERIDLKCKEAGEVARRSILKMVESR